MLRVSRTIEDETATLLLEGKLLAPWVAEVRGMVEDQQLTRARRLDLTAVAFVDAEGAKLLGELRRSGLELAGCSPLIASLIELHDHP